MVGGNRTLDRVGAARGTAYLGVMNLIQYGSFLVFYFFAARLLTEQQVGVVVFFVFFINVFPTLTLLAVHVASAKYVSENLGEGNLKTASRVSKTSTYLVAASTLPTHLVFILAIPWVTQYFAGQVTFTELLYLTVASLLTNFFSIAATNLQGLASFGKMAVVLSINATVGRGLSILLIFLGFGLSGVSVGWLIGALAAVIAGYAFLRRRFQSARADFPIRKLLSYSYPVLVFQLMVQAQTWVDVWILYTIIPNLGTLGAYHLAMTGASIVSIASLAVTATIFPAISAQHGKNYVKGIRYSLQASSRLLNFLVLPLGAILASLSPLLVEIVFGSTYLGGYPAFMISCLFAIVPAYFMLYATALQAIGYTKPLLAIVSVSFVTDIAAAYFLTTVLGLVGTALARSVMYAVTLLVSYGFLSKRVKPSVDFGSLKKMVLFSATVSIPLFFMNFFLVETYALSLLVRLAILCALAVVLFFAAGGVWKPLSKDDFNVLGQASPKKLKGVVWSLSRVFCEKQKPKS